MAILCKKCVGMTKALNLASNTLVESRIVAGHVHALVHGGFTVYSVYGYTGEGMAEGNTRLLRKLAYAIAACRGPWMAASDFNLSGEQLLPFAHSVSAVLVEAPLATCVQAGSESKIDHFLMSVDVAKHVGTHWVDLTSGLSPHRPLLRELCFGSTGALPQGAPQAQGHPQAAAAGMRSKARLLR